MNILTISDSFYPERGGSERVSHEISKILADKGHNVYVLTRMINNTPHKEVLNGINIIRFPVKYGTIPFHLTMVLNTKKYFERLVEEYKLDIVILHHGLTSFGVNLSKKSKKIIKIRIFHAPWHKEIKSSAKDKKFPIISYKRYLHPLWIILKSYLAKKIERFNLDKMDKIIVLSEYSKRQLQEILPINENKIKVIPPGIDTEKFKPTNDKIKVRKELNLPEEKFIILTVRRLVSRMGIENLIYAFKMLKEKKKNLLLVICGEGILKEKLINLIEKLNIANDVVLTGFIDEELLPLYYQSADLFVIPSIEVEGFGLVILEALSSNLSVLGTPIGAIPEILEKIDKNLLFEDTTPEAIYKGILSYLEEGINKEYNFREYIKNYTWEKSIQEIESSIKSYKGT